MHQDQLAVLGHLDVDLHGARPGVECALEGLDGVLGIIARRPAAVADNQHAARGAQAVQPIRQHHPDHHLVGIGRGRLYGFGRGGSRRIALPATGRKGKNGRSKKASKAHGVFRVAEDVR